MNSPRLEFVVLKDATNRFGRNAVYDFITDQLSGKVGTKPRGKRATDFVRPLARHLDQMNGHFGGKRRAFVRGPVCRQDHPTVVPESA